MKRSYDVCIALAGSHRDGPQGIARIPGWNLGSGALT
jgi:hypothetical protein